MNHKNIRKYIIHKFKFINIIFCPLFLYNLYRKWGAKNLKFKVSKY